MGRVFLVACLVAFAASGCGNATATADQAIRAFERHGIRLERTDPVVIPFRDVCWPDIPESERDGVAMRFGCRRSTFYIGKGQPPTHTLYGARGKSRVGVFLYPSEGDARRVVGNRTTDVSILSGESYRLAGRRNVVVMCVDCSAIMSRVNAALDDL